jgi:predicted transposase/invertase (TIGR01784 family)
MMSNHNMAVEFLDEFLPENFKSKIELETLKLENKSFVNKSLKDFHSDMVFSVKRKGSKKEDDDNHNEAKGQGFQEELEKEKPEDAEKPEEALIYLLLEHQSSSDYWISFRLLHYSLMLLEKYTRDKSKKGESRKKLPMIFPAVIYNGEKTYSAPKSIWELFEDPKMAKNFMSDGYKLIDLQAMSDDDLNKKKQISMLNFMLKHIYERDLISILKKMFEQYKEAILIDAKQNYICIEYILCYTETRLDESQKDELIKLLEEELGKEEGENMGRTIAQSYIDQGIEKGIEKEKEESERKIALIARTMILEGEDLEKISRFTGLSVSDLEELKKDLK